MYLSNNNFRQLAADLQSCFYFSTVFSEILMPNDDLRINLIRYVFLLVLSTIINLLLCRCVFIVRNIILKCRKKTELFFEIFKSIKENATWQCKSENRSSNFIQAVSL